MEEKVNWSEIAEHIFIFCLGIAIVGLFLLIPYGVFNAVVAIPEVVQSNYSLEVTQPSEIVRQQYNHMQTKELVNL